MSSDFLVRFISLVELLRQVPKLEIQLEGRQLLSLCFQ